MSCVCVCDKKLFFSEYKCCGQTFSNGRAYGRHKSNTHYQRYNDGTKDNQPDHKEELPVNKNSWECSICGKGYPSRLTLVRHEMEDHDTPGPSNANANRPLSDDDDDIEDNLGDPYSGIKVFKESLHYK